jgi:ssDNA-binding Zn-finger/Zn-ribbon topoisomerase 1
MTEDSSGKGSGLFGKKGKGSKEVKLCIINKFDRETFFQQLIQYGWQEVETAFTFDFDWPEKKIRKAATDHAIEMAGDLLIEVRDKDFARNPFNDYVYYIWRSTPETRGLPPPPNVGQQQAMQQMLQQQQMALMQQQQRLQRMRMMMENQQAQPQQPGGVPTGQVCVKCGSNQIQFMANGMGKCIQCGFMFQWRGAGMVQPQMQPMMQQPMQWQQQPVQQPVQQQQQQQQPQQQQVVVPPTPQSVQPGAPTPPGAKPCPKCGAVLNVFPDGSALCPKCGYTGK